MDQKDIVIEFLDSLNSGTTVEQLLQQTAEFVSRVFRPDHCALRLSHGYDDPQGKKAPDSVHKP
jgi:hypothetical protein